jgi:hypothetical protein
MLSRIRRPLSLSRREGIAKCHSQVDGVCNVFTSSTPESESFCLSVGSYAILVNMEHCHQYKMRITSLMWFMETDGNLLNICQFPKVYIKLLDDQDAKQSQEHRLLL